MSRRVKFCALEDLPERRSVIHSADGLSVALCRDGHVVYGFEDRCSHAFKPLEGARIRGGSLMCPHHGARFDLVTGAHVAAPAVRGVGVYETVIEDGDVYIVLPETADGEEE